MMILDDNPSIIFILFLVCGAVVIYNHSSLIMANFIFSDVMSAVGWVLLYSVGSSYICTSCQIRSLFLYDAIACPASGARTPNRKFWLGRGCMLVDFGFVCIIRNCLEFRILFCRSTVSL